MATRTGAAEVGGGGRGGRRCRAGGRRLGDLAQPARRGAASSAAPTTSAPRSGALPATGPASTAAAAGAATARCRPRSRGGTSTPANETCLGARATWRPGTCSSSTAWKLVPPKPKALTPARRIPPAGASHGRSSVLTVNGDPAEVDVGVGPLGVDARRQDLVVQRHGRLEQPGGAGRALEVADVRLHRAERDRAGGHVVAAEHLGQGLDLDHVADRGGGAVPLDERARRRGHARQLPGPLDGEPLADRVGGGDALALARRSTRPCRAARRRCGRRRARRRPAA